MILTREFLVRFKRRSLRKPYGIYEGIWNVAWAGLAIDAMSFATIVVVKGTRCEIALKGRDTRVVMIAKPTNYRQTL